MRKIACTMLLSVALAGCGSDNNSETTAPVAVTPTTPPPSTATIKVIGFNDFHGALNTTGTTTLPDPSAPGTTRAVPVGGAAYMASLVKQIKAKNPLNVVVGAGDLIGATPLVSALFHDEPAIDALDLIGLEFSSVGNHEFDDGKVELKRMQNGGCFPGGAVGSDTCLDTGGVFTGASFKYLAANVVDRDTGRPLFPAYGIKSFDVGGGASVKVGFVGLVLKETPTIVTPQGVAGLDFIDEAFAINSAIGELKAQGVKAIVMLIHQGAFMTSNFNDQTCAGLNGDLLKITPKLDTEVDLIVAGHTHSTLLCKGKVASNPKLAITSAGATGRFLSEIDLTVDVQSGDITNVAIANAAVVNDTAANPLPAVYPTVTADAATKALVDKYNTAVAPLQNRVIGRISADMAHNTANSAGEIALGDVIADAQLAATQGSTQLAVAAFMNPGGIRSPGFQVAQISGGEQSGEITYGEAFTVQPFGNSLVTLTLTGAQIDTMLEQQFPPTQTATRFLQVSKGFTYTWDNNGAANAKVDINTIRINGTPVVADQKYRITVNNFLAGGGDSFTILTQGLDMVGGAQDIDALETYFKANSPVAPGPQNRITRLN